MQQQGKFLRKGEKLLRKKWFNCEKKTKLDKINAYNDHIEKKAQIQQYSKTPSFSLFFGGQR
jgi:hypothetical protein